MKLCVCARKRVREGGREGRKEGGRDLVERDRSTVTTAPIRAPGLGIEPVT